MDRKNDSFEEILNKIKESNNILMSLHAGPDGDSVGVCTAMKYFIERDLDKKVRLISYDKPSEALMNTPFIKEVEIGKDITDIKISEFDLLLALDTSAPEYLGKVKKDISFIKKIFVINIDHHATNTHYGNLNYVIPEEPSACSILLEEFKKIEVEFDKKLATLLLLGICTDSGFFTFSNAERALKQSAFLTEKGGDYLESIVKPILHNRPLNLMKYYSLLVMKLKFNKEKKFAYSTVSFEEIKRLKLNLADVRLGINELQYLKEFDFVFTLVELDNGIKGSFRSQKGVDVSLFAQKLGGGGHKAASAFTLEKMPLQEAEKKVLEVIKKVGVHKI